MVRLVNITFVSDDLDRHTRKSVIFFRIQTKLKYIDVDLLFLLYTSK